MLIMMLLAYFINGYKAMISGSYAAYRPVLPHKAKGMMDST
jgi:hypothetical protein